MTLTLQSFCGNVCASLWCPAVRHANVLLGDQLPAPDSVHLPERLRAILCIVRCTIARARACVLPFATFVFVHGSRSRYSNAPTDVLNNFVHLTNVAIQKTADNYNPDVRFCRGVAVSPWDRVAWWILGMISVDVTTRCMLPDATLSRCDCRRAANGNCAV